MYDVVIIGSGAAGYAAALYTVRYKLSTLVIGKEPGGQTALAHDVENYPGFPSIKGPELMKKFQEHVIQYGGEVKADEVTEVQKNADGTFTLKLALSGEVQTRSVILALGTKRKILGAVHEKELDGKGITYCATCDGFFFRGKTVAVIGGGDAAATAALYLSDICPKVYLIVRKEKMRAEPIWIEKIMARTNIEVFFSSEVQAFHGEQKLEAVELKGGKMLSGIQGAFIEIGSEPSTKLVDHFNLAKDEKGFLIVNADQSTKVPGLFAAGDITNLSNHFHQIATAIGEGSVAANAIFNYLTKE